MPPYHAWQALHGQGWPASTTKETAFVEDLRRAASLSPIPAEDRARIYGLAPHWPHDYPTRTAVTVLLNALRCGVTWPQLVMSLPAAKADELLIAYEFLTRQLTDSTDAWNQLLADPHSDAWVHYGPVAARLLPVPVHRIGISLVHVTQSHLLVSAVNRIAAEVRRVSEGAARIEERLHEFEPGHPTAIRLGRSLHDVSEPGVWTHPYFAAQRVGQLSTTRVRDMLSAGHPDAQI